MVTNVNSEAFENDLYTKAAKILEEYITKKNLRKTPERNYLLKLIYSKEHHFDVEELFASVSALDFKLSKATLYNSLELFIECGIVLKHYLNHNTSVYEKAYGQRQHDHFVCNNCKSVIEFCDPRLYMIKKSLEESLHVKIDSHNLYLYGTCSNSACKETII